MKSPYQIIQTLSISEKSSRETEKHNCYAFRVDSAANKHEIKRAVETIFKVRVAKVNTMNRVGKQKRLRTMNYGMTPAWKRAVVTLREGSTIDLT